MSEPSSCRARREAGETLIELLVSMVIVGIMGAAVLGAVMMAVDVSMMHKNEVQVQQVLRSWAEKVTNTDDASFSACRTASCLEALAPSGSGLSVSASQIECWTAAGFDSATCDGSESLRRVKLTVSASGGSLPGTSQFLQVVQRRPCSTASAC